MATTLKKLTGMGGDVRKIAALLQKKAPPGHKLAYINDEEAALLKARGGSGKPHADTGVPLMNQKIPVMVVMTFKVVRIMFLQPNQLLQVMTLVLAQTHLPRHQ